MISHELCMFLRRLGFVFCPVTTDEVSTVLRNFLFALPLQLVQWVHSTPGPSSSKLMTSWLALRPWTCSARVSFKTKAWYSTVLVHLPPLIYQGAIVWETQACVWTAFPLVVESSLIKRIWRMPCPNTFSTAARAACRRVGCLCTLWRAVCSLNWPPLPELGRYVKDFNFRIQLCLYKTYTSLKLRIGP